MVNLDFACSAGEPMTEAQQIHQLERRLAEWDSLPDADVGGKIAILNDLAWALSDTEMQRAQALSETAYALANAADNGAPLDRAGMAYSLRTQGYINQRLGDYPLGISQLLKAQGIFESLDIADGLADVFDGLCGIYGQIGDFPEALGYAYRQLDVARRIGDQRRVANAGNNLASIYSESGDYERAIETGHRNLQMAREINFGRVVCLSLLNLAQTYLLSGDGARSLENGLQGLRVCQETGLELFEAYALDLIGRSHMNLGTPLRAISYLEQALELAGRLESKVVEPVVLLGLGEAYRGAQRYDRALEYLHQVIAVARSIGAKIELFKAHLSLSEIYQQQGDLASALQHLKEHHAWRERVFNEKADQRLKVLQVAHDTETAKKEAEIAHLRAVELHQEIAEHARVKLQLQRQLDYARALNGCSQTLLLVAEFETRQQEVLNQALEHLRVGSQASRAYVFRNFQDPELGPCTGIFAEACAPDIHPHLNVSRNRKVPWSQLPAFLFDVLQAGKPEGGPVETLFASTPHWLEAFRHSINPLLSIQCFPIFIDHQWWGFVGFDDCKDARQWGAQEIMLLGTASEMIASTLQRWQAEADLRSLNDRLEQQVRTRTAELNDTVALLRQEIVERERAEAKIRQMVETLEQRVAARTEELATFFDLILLAGQGIGLSKILEQVLPQVIEVTRSEAVGIDLLDADRSALILVAKENFPAELPARLPVEELPPEFQRWLQGPNDPLNMRDVESMPSLLLAFRSLGLQTYLGAQIRIGDRTEGVLSCFRFTERGYSADETALILALAHQIGLILEIDRLRTDAEAVAVLEERQRLARDLHDSVTQSLYSLSLFSRAALEATEDGDAGHLHYSLTEIERNTVQALREMRMLLYELRPADLDQEGLTHAIELRLNAVERRTNLQVDARLDELAGLSPRQEIDLYHIVVEALNNVVKHAAATRVTLRLTRDGECVRLRVVDDGRGFDPAQTRGGMGLRNIRERVAQLGGQLTISSEPGAGTRLEAVILCSMEEDQ